MAQTSLYTLITSSEMVGTPEDVSDEIFHLAPWETPLLNRVGMNSLQKPVTATAHLYQEIQERPTRTTLATAISSSATTTFVLTDAIAAAGDNIQINEEVITLGTTSDRNQVVPCLA
jgi:hypothetical protein